MIQARMLIVIYCTLASYAIILSKKGWTKMIPIIGYMIGIYIIVRMIVFLSRRPPRDETVLVKVASAITIFIVLILMLLLFVAETSVPDFMY